MYNYNHLYYFYLIVKLDGVTKAANHLKTSQSSLSIQMRQFEVSLNRKIFKKEGRKLVLTSDGQTIYSFCKSSFELFEEMGSYLESKSTSGRKRLRIGVSDEIERPFVSSLVGEVVRKDIRSEVIVNLHSADHKEIMKKFLVRDIDVAITSDPILSNGIKYSAVINLPVGVVASSKLIKKEDNIESTKKFIKECNVGIALPSSTLKLRKEIDAYLTKSNINRNVSFESNVVSTIVRSVADSTTFSILPLAYVEKEIKQGKIVHIGNKNKMWEHKIFIYSYSENIINEICSEISDFYSVRIN